MSVVARVHVWVLVVASAVLFAMPAAGQVVACAGDCNADNRVRVDELVLGVNIALERADWERCPTFDADGDERVDVSELVSAVGNAQDGCPEGDEAVFLIRACRGGEVPAGQTFRILLRDPAVIAEAEDLIGKGSVQIVTGSLVAGDGGFNAPWSWHHVPDTVSFADFTIELCDGCPMYIEENLEEWLETVGTYCPWSTEVVARER